MKRIIFNRFSALVVQIHVHINVPTNHSRQTGQESHRLGHNSERWLLFVGGFRGKERIPQ
jgi:hypothetical protein